MKLEVVVLPVADVDRAKNFYKALGWREDANFAAGGDFRGPFGARYAHRGADELRSCFARCFSAGGGIGLQHCAVTDDGVRCALEYNCVRWGSHDLPPQAGLGVYERGPGGLLAAARVYDDVEPPAGHP